MRGLASHEGEYLAPSPIPKIAAAYQSNMINWLKFHECDQKVRGNEQIMMIKITFWFISALYFHWIGSVWPHPSA